MRTPMLVAVLSLIGLSACNLALGEKQFEGQFASRMYADWIPPHSLRLVQVVNLATREYLEKTLSLPDGPTLYQTLKAAGIPDEEIHDGSVGRGIAFCCEGEISKQTLVMFYIPEGLTVEPGNIVEIKVGEIPHEGNLGTFPNFATRVRQKVDGNGCRWEPDDPYFTLWAKVLYCQGLKEEGWVQATKKVGVEALWYRPPQP